MQVPDCGVYLVWAVVKGMKMLQTKSADDYNNNYNNRVNFHFTFQSDRKFLYDVTLSGQLTCIITTESLPGIRC